MITHVVLFKLKDRSEANQQRVRQKLLTMQGNIPQLRYLEVGADALHSERSFDISLITRFDTWQDADAYQSHPFHQEMLAFMRSVTEKTVAVDYELPDPQK